MNFSSIYIAILGIGLKFNTLHGDEEHKHFKTKDKNKRHIIKNKTLYIQLSIIAEKINIPLTLYALM